VAPPIFTAIVDTGTPPPGTRNSGHVDSPLTNPRAAPQPPAIKFIPPTPNDELDRQLGSDGVDDETKKRESARPGPICRQSLLERARRYSESFVHPFLGRSASISRRYSDRRSRGPDYQDTNLHPLWRPRGFWEDFDSESEDEEFLDEPLPLGRDTSETEAERKVAAEQSWIPRMMSVRMAGFRGKGGFLLGNSLGVDRHGTNNRRHYIDLPPSLQQKRSNHSIPSNGAPNGLRKRKSEQMLRTLSVSTESLRRTRSKRQKIHRIPGLNIGVQYVGFKGFKERMRQLRGEKEEKAAEKRRDRLRGRIGARVLNGA